MVTPTSGVSGSSSSNLFTSQVDNPNSVLGKDAFLKMLITKLQNQDPLNPVTDESFISDMAQFSSLEQMSNLNSSFSTQSTSMNNLNSNLIALITMQNTTQAAGLIGKSVSLTVTAADGTKSTVSGKVDVVKFVDGQPKIVVGGIVYDISQVSEIKA